MGWAGGHIGAVWAVFIQVRVAAGGHICPQQGGGKHAQRRRDRAPRRNEGAHSPLGVAVPSQAHPDLPAYHPQSTAKAIWPRCGSNLLRWRFANQAAPACYVASWPNCTSGRPGNAHAAGAMAMEHAGGVENVR